MKKAEGNPNTEARKNDQWAGSLRYSRFVMDSSFVIRHSSF